MRIDVIKDWTLQLTIIPILTFWVAVGIMQITHHFLPLPVSNRLDVSLVVLEYTFVVFAINSFHMWLIQKAKIKHRLISSSLAGLGVAFLMIRWDSIKDVIKK